MSQQYQFTNNWFGINHRLFNEYLTKFNDQKVNVLEVGCFEGRSTTWLVDNVLGHPESTMVAIDPFLSNDPTAPVVKTTYNRFLYNLAESKYPEKVTHFHQTGEEAYPILTAESYDLCYIDGCHMPWNIVHDMCNVWRLTKVGGMIICDDYGSDNRFGTNHSPGEAMRYFLQNVLKGQGYQIKMIDWALYLIKTANHEFKDEELTLDHWKTALWSF